VADGQQQAVKLLISQGLIKSSDISVV